MRPWNPWTPTLTNDALDSTNDQEALCADRIWKKPWINILEEAQEKQQKEGLASHHPAPPLTLIMLGLLWLQDINPDIDWTNLTMRFSSPKASLVAAIPHHIQSTQDSNISDVNAITSGGTQSPSTLNDGQESEEDVPLP
ncbi:hypothetical protein E4T56_gene852 [Termitomyces sp. T112]|nr:hypothetical protein E4T56_gene852 [Termitomyces sp. T112]